jgi:hypothetical protein
MRQFMMTVNAVAALVVTAQADPQPASSGRSCSGYASGHLLIVRLLRQSQSRRASCLQSGHRVANRTPFAGGKRGPPNMHLGEIVLPLFALVGESLRRRQHRSGGCPPVWGGQPVLRVVLQLLLGSLYEDWMVFSGHQAERH